MRAVAALASIALVAGCYRTRFEVSPPAPEMPSGVYTEHFHINVIGIVEASSPINLYEACYGAPPVAIEEQIGPIAALINALALPLLGALHFNNVTVMCPANPQRIEPPPPYPQPQPLPPQPAPPG